MIEIICGEKGKGKTKVLLDKVNSSVATAAGNVVYLDKSQKHMYELNNKVRLINVIDYPVTNGDEFLGFICGIVSQDHDLEEMYLDSFLTIASIDSDADIVKSMEKLDIILYDYNNIKTERNNSNHAKLNGKVIYDTADELKQDMLRSIRFIKKCLC